jgi:hypothetical protein
MTDFRTLCKELVEDLEGWLEFCGTPSDLPVEESASWDLVKKAYRALKDTNSES